jgi:hypothetical protein
MHHKSYNHIFVTFLLVCIFGGIFLTFSEVLKLAWYSSFFDAFFEFFLVLGRVLRWEK